jgi:hypothetical protein
MFKATDTAWARWFVGHSDDKRRVDLNITSHLLRCVLYEEASIVNLISSQAYERNVRTGIAAADKIGIAAAAS